jgi:hypothetical protein
MTNLNRNAFLSAVVIACFTSACATPLPHKQLETAPTARDSFQERSTYYKAHVADRVEFSQTGYLQLHGGERIYWPEDLMPAVDKDSPTGKALTEHVAMREEAEFYNTWFTSPGMFVALGGMVGTAVGFSFAVSEVSGDFGATFTHPYFLIPAAITVGGLAYGYTGMIFGGTPGRLANESLMTALSTYNQSLEDRLGVHSNADGQIIDTQGVGGLGTSGEGDAGAPSDEEGTDI